MEVDDELKHSTVHWEFQIKCLLRNTTNKSTTSDI